MSNKTYVVVGGVAGGAGVAARLRRLDEAATIIMYEKGPYVSFANCGLPYYAGGTIKERDSLFVTPVSTFTNAFNIDVRVETEVVSIDREKKCVKAINVSTKEEHIQNYDHLVLSPGCEPFIPPINGMDDSAVLSVRNVPDIDKVVEKLQDSKKAVVVGGGFIGIEMAENLIERGLDVSLVEAADQVMITMDLDMVAPVHETLRQNGIKLYLSQALQAVERVDDKVNVVLPNTTIEDVDLVILSIGVRPSSQLARDAKLELGPRGHIVVDKFCLTSDKNISAIGDAIEYPSPQLEGSNAIALAGPANKMARLCADAIVTGTCREYVGTYGNSIAKVFDLSCGSVGLNEKMLERANLDYGVAVTHASHHAGYYPGALSLTAKILYDKKTGKLYGGQAVGYASIDKKLDVLSSFISKEGTIEDLANFEQAYAPPFNGAKDILNMLGFIALNEMDGLDKVIDYKETEKRLKEGAFLLDVRTLDEFKLGSIEGSTLIPHTEIRSRINEIPKDRDVIIMCAIGLRGHITYRILAQNGYTKIYNLTGGYKTLKGIMEDRTARHNVPLENVLNSTVCNACDIDLTDEDIVEIDACGLQCPGPILQLKKKIDSIEVGQALKIRATDPGFHKDVNSWCKMTNNTLCDLSKKDGVIEAIIKKGNALKPQVAMTKNGASIIVFSNDFDKALAAFVLANGAAATGKDVTMFFTFWGLSVLRTKPNKKVKKDFMGKMFGAMLPSDMDKLKLSNMNFASMGPKMMKSRMKKKNVDQLRSMFRQAQVSGVKMIACQMSMDIMGVDEKELLDGVEIGGVATYMEAASQCDVNLFI
jgi:NADPH-dependent 2,4-dienoyl-CoA reductase/sulfur reductase-like enzyme/peroxiredoxin family protein/TusA-related sulfurtransferase/rhodanese-related sulfurtransferase